MRVETQRLIKQADRDLENAAKNVGIAAFEVAAFLAEQWVEKYLKAAWTVLTTPRRAIRMRRMACPTKCMTW